MSSSNNHQENGVNKESAIEAERAKCGFLFTEDVAPGLKIEVDLKRIFCSTQSQYQKIDVIETYFGKTLVTDGKTQSAEFDEFVYHESLVHPPMLTSAILSNDPDGSFPKSVFIGGGGELATAREVLRHKSVERVVMVDLDEKVIEVCKRYLPEWGGDAVCADPRFELVVGDAHAYMINTKETFDVIIMDISDPIEAGPGIMLYTKEFYEHAVTRLNPHGVFVTQSGSADSIPPTHSKEMLCFAPIYSTLKSVFDCVVPYTSSIPSFAGDWGFNMAFNNPQKGDQLQIDKISPEKIDELIDKRITHMKDVVGQKCGEGDDVLKYYDGTTHTAMFALSKPLRKEVYAEKRLMTRDNPIFMF
uniref:thermospermine synthase n=1 Tax=Ditylum brightwellii TaxID=49249 RepID=A0A6U3Q668_9STRA|mmetsp:Transcript_17468/g.26001  ORF Transcript_17468/g.26001 Transcript_17468/m.26001 type:complete len:360 (+) Transcript_17468:127-1206(+)